MPIAQADIVPIAVAAFAFADEAQALVSRVRARGRKIRMVRPLS